jgi:hypothetical protein
MLAQFSCLADRIHRLSQEVFIGKALGIMAGYASAVLGLELADFMSGDFLKSSLIATMKTGGVMHR